MDFSFLKLDAVVDQTSSAPEVDASAPLADVPADGFKNMISQLENDKPEQVPVPVMQLDTNANLDFKPEVKAELKDDLDLQEAPTQNSDPTQNANFDLTSLVAQLNMAESIQQNQLQMKPTETPATPTDSSTVDTTTEPVLNTDSLTQILADDRSQLQTTNLQKLTTQAKLPKATPGMPLLTPNLANTLKNTNEQSTVDQAPTISTTSDDLHDLVDLKDIPTNLADLKPQADNTPSQNQMDFAKLVQMHSVDPTSKLPVQNTPTVESISAKKDTAIKSTATNPTEALTPLVTTTPSPDENKYLSVFSQLSSLVNSQTQNLVSTSNVVDPHHAHQDNLQGALQLPDQKLEIEILPKSTLYNAAALATETYNAKIKIYPPELGHITAELSIDKNSAQLHIMTQNHQVREIVEANLPQLKERLQSADINLTSVQVQTSMSGSRDQLNQQSTTTPEHLKQPEGGSEFGQQAEAVSEPEVKKNIDSLVDLYA